MAAWGSADFAQLQALRDRLGSERLDQFYRSCCRELAARLLALVIPKTPVGVYPSGSGKKGGKLRRGWGATANGARAYVNSLAVQKHGDSYIVEIINPVEYASYVEYGHRTRGGTGWVPGRYMLTISESELERVAPNVLERKLQALLKEVLNG